ncbi:UNVERIFIED_CONTAM: hypothetical protein FKN15_017008 [Acipenser sinensis]
MEFILLKYAASGTVYETPGAPGERFSAEVDSSSQRFTLNITGVLLSDSLVYYCALRPTVKQHSSCQHYTAQLKDWHVL